MRDDLSLGEYICLLAEAFDAEELDRLRDHNMTMAIALGFNRPRKLPRWKWSSIDKAGTAPRGVGKQKVAAGIASMAMLMSLGVKCSICDWIGKQGKNCPNCGALTIPTNELRASPSSYIYERAKHTGRRIIYMDNDMNHYDEFGQSIEREPTDLIIRISTEEH